MKKSILVSLAVLVAIGLFLLGWIFGQKSADKPAEKFISALMYGDACNQVTDDEVLMTLIDSGQIEKAKQSLDVQMAGNIFALNAQSEPTNSEISAGALNILLQMDADMDAKYGSKIVRANKIPARVAKSRQEHPWTAFGGNSQGENAEAEAKLTSILNNAVIPAK